MISVIEIWSRSIGKEDVVIRIALDGFGEELDGLFIALSLEGLIALILELGGLLWIAH